jgi:hypothetical protein
MTETEVGHSKELFALRRRVKAQRRELRRLNKQLAVPAAAYWYGFRSGLDANRASTLRGKMIKAFGNEAVRAAEE